MHPTAAVNMREKMSTGRSRSSRTPAMSRDGIERLYGRPGLFGAACGSLVRWTCGSAADSMGAWLVWVGLFERCAAEGVSACHFPTTCSRFVRNLEATLPAYSYTTPVLIIVLPRAGRDFTVLLSPSGHGKLDEDYPGSGP